MTTTIKHRDFCREDMKDKTVLKLPGIGSVLGAKLTENGYPLAKDVYSQLQAFDFDKAKFQEWLKLTCGGNLKQSSDCYAALKEWDEQYTKNKTSTNSQPANKDKTTVTTITTTTTTTTTNVNKTSKK